MEVQFVILQPARKKGAVTVRLPIMVGRSDEAKFRVQQDSVSRRHCEFFKKGDVVFVRDLGSTNGTFLDGEPIPSTVATAVKPGAKVRVGLLVFRVEYESGTVVMAAGTPSAADTQPLGSADVAHESGVGTEITDALPVDEAEPATEEPLAEATPVEAEPVEAEPAADEERDATAAEDAPASPSGFGFLETGTQAAADPGDDDTLNDFFKSLK